MSEAASEIFGARERPYDYRWGTPVQVNEQFGISAASLKAAWAQVIKMAYPTAVVQVKSDGQAVDREMLSSVSLYVLLYLILTLIMAVVYSAFGIDLLTAVSASVSMMSNVGPCFGSFGSSMSNFSMAPEAVKVLMGFQMIIGRLGIYSILLVFVLYRKRA